MTEDTRLLFECTFGDKSHINNIGKIVFAPVLLIIIGTWVVLDFLFSAERGGR